MKTLLFILGLALLIGGCSHESLTPKNSDVKASKEAPDSSCTEIGKVTGATNSVHGTPEDALEDMKRDTTNHGGNYVAKL